MIGTGRCKNFRMVDFAGSGRIGENFLCSGSLHRQVENNRTVFCESVTDCRRGWF